MQKYICFFLLVLCCSLSACKDQRSDAGDTAATTTTAKTPISEKAADLDEMIVRLQKRFDLTDAQVQEVKQIHAGYDFAAANDTEAKRLFQQFRKAVIDQVLTEEQSKNLKGKKN